MKLPSEILGAALKLLYPAKAWTQGMWARDAKGLSISPKEGGAVCFCARGAILAVGENLNERLNAELFLMKAIGTRNIAVWNDDPERRVTQVRKAFRDAIKIAKAERV